MNREDKRMDFERRPVAMKKGGGLARVYVAACATSINLFLIRKQGFIHKLAA
jgi:hypothetical protein